MTGNTSFLDELLLEAEANEHKLHLAHVDLILVEMMNLEEQIKQNFEQSEVEKKIIDEWTLRKNSKLQDRFDWMSKQLERFMYEQGDDVKTIDLPNGKLLRRKQPDKIEIADMDTFMLNADSSMLTVIPEAVRADLNKIKAYYKRSLRVPEGAKLVIGEDKFSIKLKPNGEEENGTETEVRTGNKQTSTYQAAV